MLYVNDELVKPGTPFGNRYDKFRKEVLPKLKNPVIIKTSRLIKFNDTGLPEPLPNIWIPLEQVIEGEDGGEHWRYCDRPPRKKGDGNFVYSPRGLILKNAWTLDKSRDSEKIFFFHEISSFTKKGELIFEDRVRDAEKILDKETADLDVKWTITSTNSPISVEQTGGEETLRMIAASWGIEDAHDRDKQSVAEIKVALLNAVVLSQKNYASTHRGNKEFLEEVGAKEKLVIMANVQKAIDTHAIEYDRPTFTWRFVVSNTPLMSVPARDAGDPKRALKNFLSLNENAARILSLALSDPYGEPKQESVASVDDMNYAQLIENAKELGIKYTGVKADVLRKQIADAMA